MTLPSEAEWEKVARGGVEIPKQAIKTNNRWLRGNDKGQTANFKKGPNKFSKRRYPWGDEPDANNANCYNTKIGDTSAVGCFPGGVSLYGCEDMSGNVWEWCRTKWRDNYQSEADDDLAGNSARVLRGGAFFFNDWDVRCARRNWFNPIARDNRLGFRVVVSP